MSQLLASAAAEAIEGPAPIFHLAHIPEGSEKWDPPGRVLVLPGSWNPPHSGHEALLKSGTFDHRLALLSTYNADKGHLSSREVFARLQMTELALPDCYVAVTNIPLLVDQADVLSRAWRASRLSFAMGWDTWVRFNDPAYLGERHGAEMERFFSRHHVVVSTRGMVTPAAAMLELRDYYRQHPDRRARVHLVDCGESWSSSTAARQFIADGRLPPHVKPEVFGYAAGGGLYREDRTG